MHVKQVELLQSGVRLLTGFQRGSGDRFEAVLETGTEEEIKAAADGLVTVLHGFVLAEPEVAR